MMQILTQAGRGLLGEQVASENLFSCLLIILCLEFQHGLGLVFCQPQGFQIKICQSKGQVLQPAKEKNNSSLNLRGQEGPSPQLQTAPPEQRGQSQAAVGPSVLPAGTADFVHGCGLQYPILTSLWQKTTPSNSAEGFTNRKVMLSQTSV